MSYRLGKVLEFRIFQNDSLNPKPWTLNLEEFRLLGFRV